MAGEVILLTYIAAVLAVSYAGISVVKRVSRECKTELEAFHSRVFKCDWDWRSAMGNTVFEQVVAAWNTEADEFNQWDALDEQEKIEHAIRFLSETKENRVCRWVKTRGSKDWRTSCGGKTLQLQGNFCPRCRGEIEVRYE